MIFHWRNDVKNVREIVTVLIIFTYHWFNDAIIYMCSLTVTVHVIDNTVQLHLGMLKYSYRLLSIVQGGPNWYWAAVVNSVTCSYSQALCIISNSSQLVWILYNCDLLSLGMFNVKWWHSVFRFKFWPREQLFWLKYYMIFVIFSSQIQGEYRILGYIYFLPHYFNSLFTNPVI